MQEADKLLLEFCEGFQNLYGKDECTPNMHMHCHLSDCIMDVGPLHSFWCFSFERYNGILEKMQKSWQTPEIQLIHKFTSLQTLVSIELPSGVPQVFRQCFTQMKETKTAIPDAMDGLDVLAYEQNKLCVPKSICATKLCFHHPVIPGREKYLTEEARDALAEMYSTIYGAQNVLHVPLYYEEFREVKLFQNTYTSSKSRSTRSATVAAIWPSPSGILDSRSPSGDDIRVGVIQYFLLHTPVLKSPDKDDQVQKTHILAQIEWYQDHPRKFSLGNGVILAATVPEPSFAASFMPISRIISHCAVINQKVAMDYGEDYVCVALPLRRHKLFCS